MVPRDICGVDKRISGDNRLCVLCASRCHKWRLWDIDSDTGDPFLRCWPGGSPGYFQYFLGCYSLFLRGLWSDRYGPGRLLNNF